MFFVNASKDNGDFVAESHKTMGSAFVAAAALVEEGFPRARVTDNVDLTFYVTA